MSNKSQASSRNALHVNKIQDDRRGKEAELNAAKKEFGKNWSK